MGGWWWGFLIDVYMTAKCQNATGKTYSFYIHVRNSTPEDECPVSFVHAEKNFFGVIKFIKYIYYSGVLTFPQLPAVGCITHTL
jgi:hypothetical protein